MKNLFFTLAFAAASMAGAAEIDVDGSFKSLSMDGKTLAKWSCSNQSMLEILPGKEAGTHELYVETAGRTCQVLSRGYLSVPENERTAQLSFECRGVAGFGANICLYGPKGVYLDNHNLKNMALGTEYQTHTLKYEIPKTFKDQPVRFIRVQFNFYSPARGSLRNIRLTLQEK